MTEKQMMPVVFVGHGSPTNAIGDNIYIPQGRKMGEYLGKPEVIIAISSHWYCEKLFVRTADVNKQINDRYGFPDELYQVHYEPEGHPQYAEKALKLLGMMLR